MTASHLLNDPVFLLLAPVGLIALVVVIYILCGGDTDMW